MPTSTSMKKKEIRNTVELPEGMTVKLEQDHLTLSKDKTTLTREFPYKRVQLEVQGSTISLASEKYSKKERKIVGTVTAHIKNMVRGIESGHTYKLKICSGHFPMNAAAAKNEFVVKNFLGEKKPRVLKLKENVDVKIEGDIVVVTGPDKELAGQTAADIELLCRITNRDPRIFQDGIWITEKDGKNV